MKKKEIVTVSLITDKGGNAEISIILTLKCEEPTIKKIKYSLRSQKTGKRFVGVIRFKLRNKNIELFNKEVAASSPDLALRAPDPNISIHLSLHSKFPNDVLDGPVQLDYVANSHAMPIG